MRLIDLLQIIILEDNRTIRISDGTWKKTFYSIEEVPPQFYLKRVVDMSSNTYGYYITIGLDAVSVDTITSLPVTVKDLVIALKLPKECFNRIELQTIDGYSGFLTMEKPKIFDAKILSLASWGNYITVNIDYDLLEEEYNYEEH